MAYKTNDSKLSIFNMHKAIYHIIFYNINQIKYKKVLHKYSFDSSFIDLTLLPTLSTKKCCINIPLTAHSLTLHYKTYHYAIDLLRNIKYFGVFFSQLILGNNQTFTVKTLLVY